MEKYEDTQNKTTADFIVELMTDEQDGDEFSQEYIKAGFLSAAMRALVQARRNAELTQAQVAEQLGTKQTVIARWEKDKEGSISLRNYVEFALACGRAPLDITLELFSSLRDYAIAHPQAQRTQEAYNAWRNNSLQVLSIENLKAQSVNNSVSTIVPASFSSQDAKFAVEYADNYVRQVGQQRIGNNRVNTSLNRQTSTLSQQTDNNQKAVSPRYA